MPVSFITFWQQLWKYLCLVLDQEDVANIRQSDDATGAGTGAGTGADAGTGSGNAPTAPGTDQVH